MSHETAAILIALISPLLTAGAMVGGAKVFARVVDKRLNDLEETLQRFGKRLGDMETDLAVIKDREGRPSQPPPTPRRTTRANKATE